MGGMHGFGPVVVPGSDAPYHERWEPRVFALWAVSAAEGLGKGSGRVARELMPPEEYLRASYYERWQWSNERRLVAKGTIAEGEVDTWVERLAGAEEAPMRSDPVQREHVLEVIRTATEELEPKAGPSLQPGTRVRVKRMRPSGHTRCPRYVRGAGGVIEAVRGSYPFPDDGPRRGARETVYAVSFDSEELFGPPDDGNAWTVFLDLYEPYLEPA
jgi:nitrile hydratase subunit beta